MGDHQRDIRILRGLDVLVNRDEVADGIDLAEIERDLASDTPVYKQNTERHEPINDVMLEMSQKYGINIDDILGEAAGRQPPTGARQSATTSARQPSRSPTASYQAARTSAGYHGDDDDDDSPYARAETPVITSDDDYPRSEYARPEYTRQDYARPGPSVDYGESAPRRADDNRGRRPLNSVLGDMAGQEEYLEDEKAAMLADIEGLVESLEADNIDIKRLQENMVDKNSSYEEVSSMLRLLQSKVDRVRGATLAEELIIFGTSALEELFDGKNKWFGYSPDLTGYSNVARLKLRRVRHETGVLASSVMQNHSFGPGWRLLLELIPSMVLHARTRRQQHGERNLFDDESMIRASSALSQH